MAGRPGRSGGHNRLSVEAHLLRGTFNPSRHARPASTGPAWVPVPAALERLGPDGRDFIGRMTATYEFSGVEGEMVMEAATMVDRLSEVRARRDTYPADEVAVSDKLEMRWQKAFVGVLQVLRSRLV